ncbi:MAG: HisA/HisF-related TIM barrel protein [Pseudomonadota bacterium]
MAKKRLIFTLLYHNGDFMLSRNFRLQRAGNINWLKSNYDFKNIAFTIDELIILDVSRGEKNMNRFCDHIKTIARECFIPIAAGGGIASQAHAKAIMHSGADKLVINSALIKAPSFVKGLVSIYGSQCIIAALDVKRRNDEFELYIDNGSAKVKLGYVECIAQSLDLGIGEFYLNSMDQDGTGHGYLFDLLEPLKDIAKVPVIIAGGAGNWHHLLEGLQHDGVDAVATANLFNFIGQGFPNARKQLLNNGMHLAKWKPEDFSGLRRCLGKSKNMISGETDDHSRHQ